MPREEEIKKAYESIDSVWHAVVRGCTSPEDESAALDEFSDLVQQLSLAPSSYTYPPSPTREAAMLWIDRVGRM